MPFLKIVTLHRIVWPSKKDNVLFFANYLVKYFKFHIDFISKDYPLLNLNNFLLF